MDWNVNGVTFGFIPADTVRVINIDTSIVAHLVARTPVNGSAFNWTSVVYYTPDPSISGSIPVTCGTGIMHCMDTVLVIGKLIITPIRA